MSGSVHLRLSEMAIFNVIPDARFRKTGTVCVHLIGRKTESAKAENTVRLTSAAGDRTCAPGVTVSGRVKAAAESETTQRSFAISFPAINAMLIVTLVSACQQMS
eukprot:7253280-Prymnesium_polylepis.1